jgi:hypothetical protein
MRERTQRPKPTAENNGPFDSYCGRCGSLMVPIPVIHKTSGAVGLMTLCPRCDVLRCEDCGTPMDVETTNWAVHGHCAHCSPGFIDWSAVQ